MFNLSSLSALSSLPIKVYPGRKRPQALQLGCVLTIGSFDGVHLGHQRIIESLKAQALAAGLPAVAMTFRPDPAEFFSADQAVKSNSVRALMSWREKILGLAATGVDQIACLPFDNKVSKLSAQDFVEQLLVRQLGVKHLIIGDDFRFGADRSGDYDLLVKLGNKYQFSVQRSQTHTIGEQRISSTRIRQCLANGQLDQARVLLGRSYQLCGKVVAGHKLGRELGFPTANLPLQRKNVAMTGVFTAVTELASGKKVQAVANLGTRPAVNRLDKPLLEVHLLNYDGDLYGQRMRVYFQSRLRDEQDFDSLEALKAAIAKDVLNAREWFSTQDVYF